MSENLSIAKSASALDQMCSRLAVGRRELWDTLRQTCFKGATDAELMSLVMVANEFRLNPFLRQIHAFRGKTGGIVPIVSVDGWAKIVNAYDGFDGCDFRAELDSDGRPVSMTCEIWVKGRSHSIRVTELLSECFRETELWRNMPTRMLRHKAFMQCARIAFGLGGLYDDDEGRDAAEMNVESVSPRVRAVAGVMGERPSPARKPLSEFEEQEAPAREGAAPSPRRPAKSVQAEPTPTPPPLPTNIDPDGVLIS